MIPSFPDFDYAIIRQLTQLSQHGVEVDPGRWQGVPTEGKPDLVTVELMDVAFRVHMPITVEELADAIKPNLPWADDHFAERVSGVPSNPGEQYKNWPWWSGQVELTNAEMKPTYKDGKQLTNFKFSHTYQERFWPKMANGGRLAYGLEWPNMGIRYDYGDLDDVVNMLLKDPQTRQAYLPIFFPEDTGAVHGGRVPCTLGYHFLLRNQQLHLWYDIRSCDAVRHFRDDLYLAARLALWMIEELVSRTDNDNARDNFSWRDVRPGILTFHAHSFHVHKGDMHLL